MNSKMGLSAEALKSMTAKLDREPATEEERQLIESQRELLRQGFEKMAEKSVTEEERSQGKSRK